MSAYVVMGVSGCGKSEIGQRFAKATGSVFFDGDHLHPAENIAKMSRGEPLTDADRAPWLDQIGDQLKDIDRDTVIACSALKKVYRERITERSGQRVIFLFLEGTREILLERMKHRKGHFMPVALLDSQLETLEPPGTGECFVKASIDQAPDQVVAQLIAGIQEKCNG